MRRLFCDSDSFYTQIGFQRNNHHQSQQQCSDNVIELNDMDSKLNESTLNRDFNKQIHNINNNTNNSNNTNIITNTNIMLTPTTKDLGCGTDTYEDGIAEDIRELQRRLESELELEHEKLWSPAEKISQT